MIIIRVYQSSAGNGKRARITIQSNNEVFTRLIDLNMPLSELLAGIGKRRFHQLLYTKISETLKQFAFPS